MKMIFCAIFFFSFTVLAQEVTPTKRLYQSLEFADDMNFENLDLAIERQLDSYKRFKLRGKIKFGSDTYPKSILKDSLLLLKEIADKNQECLKTRAEAECMHELNRELNAKFTIYRPIAAEEPKTTKFTSYYSPDFTGSRVPTERFKRPIYRKPEREEDRNFTRVEIDYQGALAGKGYELFWVEESFYDLYLLHVQGGGRIKIINPDGTTEMKYLSYGGKNSHTFKMVYHYMLEQGYIKPGADSINHQRQFLLDNPDKNEEVFSVTPSYIYFYESDEEPVGLNDIPLTEGRSLAIDRRIYKTMGLINFVKTDKATHLDENGNVVKAPFSRFFIAQDTGGAIRGNARCDLYSGYGPQAELMAYSMNDMGEQYFLIKK